MTRVVPAGAVLLALALGCQPGEIDPALANQNQMCDVPAIFANTAHSCASGACHNAAGFAANFSMATAGWEMCLVGVNPKGGGSNPSLCATNGPYLKTGTPPADGLFLQKLKGMSGCGVRMPQIGTPLNSAEMACVQKWADALVTAGPGTNCGSTDAGASGQ